MFRIGDAACVYNQPAFRYFLAVEHRRAERSTRNLLLVLVNRRKAVGPSETFSKSFSATLFATLGVCFREVDIVGWYREQLVAGAVVLLNEGGAVDPTARIAERVSQKLSEHLGDQAWHLRVRVVRLGRRRKE
jgi:hypothetical protein